MCSSDLGKKKIRDKTKPTYTPEQKKLVEQRDALKKKLDELTKKPDEDEATRNKRLLKIAQDNAERWRERSEKLDFEAKQKGGEPSQEVIDARRTAEAAKEEFMQLREILRPDINYNSRLKARISNLERMRKKPGRTEYQRGILSRAADGTWEVRTTGQQGSGVLSSMVQADGLIVIAHEQGDVNPGDWVDVMLFDTLG